ncbi:LmeA family phospholipid-binding protein [Streptomyces specialis]|uniref:LmeA family phospholipid-binding protein n=1 Tax=Streptomyces specialis TaxID=498367 RepID=UPI00073EFF38|nr:LmeA family phospholipid-binding protein [Streptomyces specialis]
MEAFGAAVRRVSRRRGVRVAAVVTAVVLALAVAGELAGRAMVQRRITEAAERDLGGDVEVDVGDGLALLSLADRRLNWIEVRADGAEVGRVNGADVRVRVDDVRLNGLGSGSGGTGAGSHAEGMVPTEALLELSGEAGGGAPPISAARTDPAAGTVVLDVGGGLGQVTVMPELRGGRVEFEVTDASFLGMPVPGALVERVAEALSDPTEEEEYPLEMAATSVEVTGRGVEVVLDGGPAALEGDDAA